MPRGQRKAEVSIGARSAKLDRELRKARAKFKKFGDGTKRDLQRSFSGAKRSIGTLVGFAGIGAVGLAAKKTFEFEKRLTRLQIQSGKSKVFMDRMRGSIRRVSNETGVSSDALLDGAAQYVSLTGDMDGASTAVETFARVSAASGASMQDIAATAAALRQNLRFDPGEFEKAFSILLTQGKKGAVELRELSSLLAPLSAQFQEFGNLKASGLAELGAALQVMRQGFGSGSEAATGFTSMMTAFAKKAPAFARAGVQVFNVGKDGAKSFRTISEIVDDISRSPLMKDKTALVKAFGRNEGARAFKKLAQNRELLDQLTDAGLKSQAVAKDYLTFQESAAGRTARAWQRLQNSIAETITPERIEKFAKALEVVADLVGFVADHALEIGVAFATWRLGKGLASLATLVSNLRGAGGLGALLSGGGANAIPVTIVGAAAAGAAAGHALDRWLGISTDFHPDKQRELISGGAIDHKGQLSTRLLHDAQRTARQAQAARSGVLMERNDLSTSAKLGRHFLSGALGSKTVVAPARDVKAAEERAARLFAQAAAQLKREQADVVIRVRADERGLLKVDAERQRKARSQAR